MLLRLAIPVALAQFAMMAMGVVDILMVSVLGTSAIAATSLGDTWAFGTLIVAMGIVLGMDPIVSQAHGAGDSRQTGMALQWGLVVALLVSIPVVVAWLLTGPALNALGQEPAIAAGAHGYVMALIPGAPAFLVFVAARQFLQGRGFMATYLGIIIAANLLNAGLNWVFIYGNLGAPVMGIEGAGVASTISRFAMAGLAWGIVLWRPAHRAIARQPWSRASFAPRNLGRVLAFGLPIGATLTFEVWAFLGSTLIAGTISETALAGHTIVLKVAALMFMVPLGISIASATRVGNLIGAGDRQGAQRAAWVALSMGAIFMSGSAVLLIVFNEPVARMFSQDAEVLLACAAVFPIAAAFQVFDGVQIVGTGILRGAGDTRLPALFNLIGFYAIALPVALLMLGEGAGLASIWWALCIGLIAVSVLMVTRVRLRGPAYAISALRDA